MAKLRSLSTAFWSDPFIEELSPENKLLFIYLITNEKTNMLGIYEASKRKISFETGIDLKTVSKGLEAFERLGKVKYVKNYVIVVNFLKHQKFNTNMKKSAIDIYNDLPKELKIKGVNLDKSNPSKAFQTLSNHFGMVRKIEVEDESEIEDENEDEEPIQQPEVADEEVYPTFDDFWNLYEKKTGKEKCKGKWAKLKQSEKEELMKHIPLYKKSQPDKQYRKNPETYLNNKSWNDEIIDRSQSQRPQRRFNSSVEIPSVPFHKNRPKR